MNNEEKIVTVYVTKYALTKGIWPIEARISDGGNLACEVTDTNGYGLLLHAGEFAHTEKEALKQAQDKRVAKLLSLDRQMSKLRRLTFSVRDER